MILLKILLTLIIIWLGVFAILALYVCKDHYENKHTFRKFSLKDELQIFLAWPLLLTLFGISAAMDLYDSLRKHPASKP